MSFHETVTRTEIDARDRGAKETGLQKFRPPIFVVGDRSRQHKTLEWLNDQPGIAAVAGSGFLFETARSVLRYQSELAHYCYPEQYWFRRIGQFFDSLQGEHLVSAGRWAAPALKRDLPLIDRLYPTAQVLHVTGSGRWTRVLAEGRQMGPRRYRRVPFAIGLSRRPDLASEILAFLGEDLRSGLRSG